MVVTNDEINTWQRMRLVSVLRQTVVFETGRDYLLVGEFCQRKVFILPQGFLNVFQVAADGLLSPYRTTVFEFPNQLAELGTLERLTARLAEESLRR
jgi:hypothetical protein